MAIDVYQKITDQILEKLAIGVVPWKQPWQSLQAKNGITGKEYRGINVWLLGLNEFTDSRWLTFKAAKSIGGNPRKGEHGTSVVFWNWTQKNEENEKSFAFLKYYTVFNVEQCENLTKEKLVALPEKKNNTTAELAETVVKGYKNAPSISYQGDRAFYSPTNDAITLPPLTAFEDTASYYATLFHELTHSTGHESRLQRKIANQFGCGDYSKEELVAEFGSSFLLATAGIESTLDASAAYIENWSRVLSMDKKLIVQCASQGQKGAEHILGKLED